MGPNTNQPQPGQWNQAQPNPQTSGNYVYGNNFGGTSTHSTPSMVSDVPVRKKPNIKALALVAGCILGIIILVIILANVLNPAKTILTADEAKEVLTTEKFFNAAKFEGKYRAYVNGGVSPEVLLSHDSYEVLVNGFESYKDIYNTIKSVKTIEIDSQTIDVEDIPSKMSKALPVYESVISRYKNFYDSFKLDKNKEIEYSTVTNDAIKEYAAKLDNSDLSDYYTKYFKYNNEYNTAITDYQSRQCNVYDNIECDVLDEKLDTLNSSLGKLSQKTTSFFANGKDTAFFEENSVEEKMSNIYLSLNTGMVVENETKD